jgi:hypothetical protein
MSCVCTNSALNCHKPFCCIVVARCALVMPLVYLIITGVSDLHVFRSLPYIQRVQIKSGQYFKMSNLFTKIYNMLYYTTNLYLQ